ncbi:bifunctional glutamate N-acetyltransferase/amino-acid acetyltransferase ArgJ [Candidatus Pelagibacter communis]|uniref:bifunctional glutamate N-acetyltransferase/amino-acid acetyltransferase ArgJ n=1 Tax=Pelagibacter ubique TaxID=198252 RepID=UPI000ACA6C91|nr:bifunctional glutamate N-acetyltransferase/amino-acid acetyltransferase ArgJ [Candidatus Pelagibacter ubique]
MVLGINNFFDARNKNAKVADFQDLDHLDGVSVSAVSANLYDQKRDDLVLFYFRNGANHASLFTKSSIVSENIKWNKKVKSQKIHALLINTRNANALTGSDGYDALKILSIELSEKLTLKQKQDEEYPKIIRSDSILFACTGTIGEKFPIEKIKNSLPNLVDNIKYNQNKLIWMKAASGIKTTDTKPKLAMSECKIGNTPIKVYGIAKGSGMIFPNMATTLGFVFTDANLSSSILKNILKDTIETTFNAISCDGDTSTNDMVSIFATNKANNSEIKSHKDKKLHDFKDSVHEVLLNLAKRVAADGEGASKFVTINCQKARTISDAKKICISISNSPLVKTAISGEDPNWGRIAMAIGKTEIKIDIEKLTIFFGPYKIFSKNELSKDYDEQKVIDYMKNESLEITVDIGMGKKNFTSYTMDLTKDYIEINADYRS